MKFLDSLLSRMGYVRDGSPKRTLKRLFAGATNSRLFADWAASGGSADAELSGSIGPLIHRSRDAERNDDYVRRYLKLAENNILGHHGICLQKKVEKANGEPDDAANDAIEAAWYDWGRKENCSVTRNLTWRGLQRIILRTALRDGSVLVRIIRNFPNAYGFALQPLEVDMLDLNKSHKLGQDGREVRFGIELDQWGAPVAYHLFKNQPGDMQVANAASVRLVIPASDILHIFIPDRIRQTLGVPTTSACLRRLKMMAEYEHAELVAAREAACKGYAIKSAAEGGFTGEKDSLGRSLQSVEPGMGIELLPGEDYVPIDPQHPMDAFPAFIKQMLMATASSLGVSYNSLASDLEKVNYSSMRAGLLEERSEWMALQQWLIEDLCDPVHRLWLEHCAMTGVNPPKFVLNPSKLDSYYASEWKPRRWPWVDPEKDINAALTAIRGGLATRSGYVADQGGDFQDLCKQQKADEATAKKYGLDFEKEVEAPAPAKPPTPTPPDRNGHAASHTLTIDPSR